MQLKIDVDTTYDSEVRHTATETVAYLAIGGERLLSALAPQTPASGSSGPSAAVNALQTAFLDVSRHDIEFAEAEAKNMRDPLSTDRSFNDGTCSSAGDLRAVAQADNDCVFAALERQYFNNVRMDDTQFESRAPAGRLQHAIAESLWFLS